MVQDMGPPNDNECKTKPKKCCKKLVSKGTVDTTPSWNDGTVKTNPIRRTGIGRSVLCCDERKNSQQKRLGANFKKGAQGPMNQRPDFVDAKREFKRLHDEHVKETSEGNTPIPPRQRTRQRRNQQFEGREEYNYQVDSRTGWRTYPLKSKGNLGHPASSASSSSTLQYDSMTIGGQEKVGDSWRTSSCIDW